MMHGTRLARAWMAGAILFSLTVAGGLAGDPPPATTPLMPRAEVIEWAKRTVVPEVELKNASVDDLLGMIRTAVQKAGKPGPEVVLASSWAEDRQKQVVWKELRLKNVPVEVLLKYACEMTSTGWDYRDGRIEITPTLACWGTRRRCICGAFLTDENGAPLPVDH